MTQRKDKADGIQWKELIGNQEDFLRPLVREVIQQVLEAEMEEAVGARCCIRTNAIPVSSGNAWSIWINASRLPAEAPTPTTGNKRRLRSVVCSSKISLPAESTADSLILRLDITADFTVVKNDPASL